jgi:hypothetical protein
MPFCAAPRIREKARTRPGMAGGRRSHPVKADRPKEKREPRQSPGNRSGLAGYARRIRRKRVRRREKSPSG